VVCVREMPWPRPVHEWYDEYPELGDHEVRQLLVRSARDVGREASATAGAGAGASRGRAGQAVLAR
jgi:predicted phosphoribosyltransferase